MPSPRCEVNSASLGGWTSTEHGINVVGGETVNIRLADTAGVDFWSLVFNGLDDLVVAPTLTIDVNLKTASFTAPSIPTSGWALSFKSTIGVSALGKDANFAVQPGYVALFGVYLPTAGGWQCAALNETSEGDAAFGWMKKLNSVLRYPPGSGSAPLGAATGDLGGSYPGPDVLKVHGATVPAAGALVTGNSLHVSGVGALSYSALNLAGGANWVTGLLPVANFAAGSNGQYLTTSGGVATWAALAVTLASLAQGGATTGQALIWSGSAWAPSTNFANQNLVTTGTLGAGATTVTALTVSGLGLGVVHSSGGGVFSSSLVVNADIAGGAAIAVSKIAPGAVGQMLQTGSGPVTQWSTDIYVKPIAGALTGIWLGEGITPSGTNPSFVGDGVSITINAPTATGTTTFSTATTFTALVARTTGGAFYAPGFVFAQDIAYTLGQYTQISDTATFDLTIASQAPFATATGTNRNPGNLILAMPAPVAGGTDGFVKVSVSGTQALAFSRASSRGLVYLGDTNATTPTSTNYSVRTGNTDGITDVNAPSATGVIRLQINASSIANLANGVVAGQTTFAGFNFTSALAYTLGQNTRSSDAATFDLTLQSQTPFATATGTNRNPGNLVLSVPPPISGGADGFVKVSISGTLVMQVGSYVGVGLPYSAIYLGPVTPGAATHSLVSDGTHVTAINAPGTGGYTSASSVNIGVASAGIVTFTVSTSSDFGTKGMAFFEGQDWMITQYKPFSDAATHDLTIQSQAPFATATGTNRNSGGLVFATPAPVIGGTAGSITLKPSNTAAMLLSPAGALRLHAYTTAGFLKNDTSGNVTSSPTAGAGSVAPGAESQVLTTSGGVSSWAYPEVLTVADIPALQALDTAGFNDATEIMVRELWERYILVRSNADAQDLSYYTTVNAKQGAGTNGNWLMEAA